VNDTYWTTPLAPFAERRQRFLEYCAPHSPGGRVGFFSQIARLELGRDPVDEEPFREALALVDARQDCADFSVAGFLRVLYRYRDSPLIAPALVADIEACLLRFKYWWDEPGTDRMCYHTENHQFLYHTDELLAGQLFRDRTFANNGATGRAHIAHALPRVRRWLDDRARFGFSEWLSNCYFDEDWLALANLVDFAEDATLRARARACIDYLLLQLALHSHHGVFGSTHGRTYAPLITGGRAEYTAGTAKLIFGVGTFNDPARLGAVALATSTYRCPPLSAAIATDSPDELRVRERHSLDVEDAPAYGIRYDSPEDGPLFWSIQAFFHPRTIGIVKQMSEGYRAPLYRPFAPFLERYERDLAEHGRVLDPHVADATALTAANVVTHRTPSTMLSCAQDYRAGLPGYQQHIWQATLGPDAVVFTNHPGAADILGSSRPNFWAGNGRLPRAAQHRNVLVCLHRAPADDPFPYSHAYFPRAAFDEVVERDGWTLARAGDGFLALHSRYPARFADSGPHADIELRADAPENAWLSETGTRQQWGSFDRFVAAIGASEVAHEARAVRYHSPSLGLVEFGWADPLRVAGQDIPLRNYPRLDSPYGRCDFADPHFTIHHGDASLRIDLANGRDT
jgi:hypothetical protein